MNQVVIINDADGFLSEASERRGLNAFIMRGGRVLLLNARSALAEVFPDVVKGYVARDGEIVAMHVPESPVFSGIEPLDLAWFEGGGRRLPIACSGVYQIVAGAQGVTSLADQCDIHAYLRHPSEITRYSGSPLVEIKMGKGSVVAGEMNFKAGKEDPIARRLLSNIVNYLGSLR
jgi:hypothetical protein